MFVMQEEIILHRKNHVNKFIIGERQLILQSKGSCFPCYDEGLPVSNRYFERLCDTNLVVIKSLKYVIKRRYKILSLDIRT